jgi:hexosaminidase
VVFTNEGADPALGEEGYVLSIQPGRIEVVALAAPGFIWGVRTIQQILPPAIESFSVQPGTWEMPAATIRDTSRFAWRGFMLDVARGFEPLPDLERLVELMSEYKMNRLHLHLTDDQGWRIQIPSQLQLTSVGATRRVGGGGGFYTDAQYRQLVAYAQERGVVVVPEIDMPAHVTAALIADPALACDDKAPSPKTGLLPSPNAVCTTRESTYRFVDDVVRDLAAMTRWPYLHIGGDEAIGLSTVDYASFVTRAAQIVESHGKQPIAWDDVISASHATGALVQVWHLGIQASPPLLQAPGVIVSLANRAYLDQKYNRSLTFGMSWAGFVDTETAYDWDPRHRRSRPSCFRDPRSRGGVVVRHLDQFPSGRVVDPAPAPGLRGARLVSAGRPELERLPRPAGLPGAPVDRSGPRLLPGPGRPLDPVTCRALTADAQRIVRAPRALCSGSAGRDCRGRSDA